MTEYSIDSSNRMFFSILILVHVCVAFPLKCPEPAQWSLRARGHCPDPSKYFCLKNDLINGFSENCTIFDFLQPGRKHVLRGGLDADICSSERYQPWPINFNTNVSTNCIFRKTECKEEGQLLHGKGNRNTDTTCRCDYKNGYDFLIKPKNICFCVPSKEDCSCYLKACKDSRYVLSQDYECIDPKNHTSVKQCNLISNDRINTEANQSDTEYTWERRNTSTLEKYRTIALFFVTSVLPVLIFFSIPLAIVIEHCYHEHSYFLTGLAIYPQEPLTGDDIHISCKTRKKDLSAKWYKDDFQITNITEYKDKEQEQEHTLTIQKAKMSDSGVYCIQVKGRKRQIHLNVEDYFSNGLTIRPKEPIEGNDISISCKVKKVNISADWYRNGKRVKETNRIKINEQDQEHTLTIYKARPIDSDRYCIEIKGVKKEIQLEVEGYFSKDLTMSPKNPIEGKDVFLSCKLQREHISVTWDRKENKKDAKVISKVKNKKHTLKIPRATTSDNGIYYIDVEGVKREIKLEVEDYFSEELKTEPENPIEGNDIVISCKIKRKHVSATWLKNDNKLSSKDKVKSTVKKKTHTLTIPSAEKSDSGTYCIEFSSVQRQIDVKVEDYFSEGLSITPENPKEGNEINITCTIKRMHISATWLKNGTTLNFSDKVKITVKDKQHTLIILRAQKSDSGTYCIEVEGVKRQIDVNVEENKGRRK